VPCHGGQGCSVHSVSTIASDCVNLIEWRPLRALIWSEWAVELAISWRRHFKALPPSFADKVSDSVLLPTAEGGCVQPPIRLNG